MPCLLLKTNQKIAADKKIQLSLSASAKISTILSKPEHYVMVMVEDGISLSMSGTTEPAAYLELKSINLPEDRTSDISREICQFINQETGIDSQRIYIEFSNAKRHLWGWDEKTF